MNHPLFFSLSLLLLSLPSPLSSTPTEDCVPPSPRHDGEAESWRVFERVWEKVEREREGMGLRMVLPKEIVWLMGAPGAGKGTNTQFIMEVRGIKQTPIVISELLDEVPEAAEIKAKGETMSDDIVLELLLHALLHPSSYHGVIVDGFPRTKTQVQFVKYLHDTIHINQTKHKPHQIAPFTREYHHNSDYNNNNHYNNINNNNHNHYNYNKILTKYRVCVLYVEEKASVERQLGRGREAQARSKEMAFAEDLPVVRPTDLDEDLARYRYKSFHDVLGELLSLQQRFPFDVVDAYGSFDDVRARILDEFDYQEREHLFQRIPKASDVTKFMHQHLIHRLNSHKMSESFQQILRLIENKIVPSIQRNAYVGEAIVELQGTDFFSKEEETIQIIIDVLAHQGYLTQVVQFDKEDDTRSRALGMSTLWELSIKF